MTKENKKIQSVDTSNGPLQRTSMSTLLARLSWHWRWELKGQEARLCLHINQFRPLHIFKNEAETYVYYTKPCPANETAPSSLFSLTLLPSPTSLPVLYLYLYPTPSHSSAFGLGKLYDTRKLGSHGDASYVAVSRFDDNDVKSFFRRRERSAWEEKCLVSNWRALRRNVGAKRYEKVPLALQSVHQELEHSPEPIQHDPPSLSRRNPASLMMITTGTGRSEGGEFTRE